MAVGAIQKIGSGKTGCNDISLQAIAVRREIRDKGH